MSILKTKRELGTDVKILRLGHTKLQDVGMKVNPILQRVWVS